ncbi:hypothetical protein BJV77DRAFT_1027228 [Russula vinacea]|nr:hypothetical protein BJV77DRAFT_1027228 [Russula vinacea]
MLFGTTFRSLHDHIGSREARNYFDSLPAFGHASHQGVHLSTTLFPTPMYFYWLSSQPQPQPHITIRPFPCSPPQFLGSQSILYDDYKSTILQYQGCAWLQLLCRCLLRRTSKERAKSKWLCQGNGRIHVVALAPGCLIVLNQAPVAGGGGDAPVMARM